MLLLIAAGIFGAGVGIAAYIGLLQTVPLYQEEVLFEVRPGVRDVRDLGANDLPQDQLVTRLGMTESLLMTQRKILESAISTPAVISTAWFQDNYVDENGTELIDEAVKDIKEELSTAPLRNTNLFALRWRARVANDVPVVLNTIKDAYLAARKAQNTEIYDQNYQSFDEQARDTLRDIEDLDGRIRRFMRERSMDSRGDTRNSQLGVAMEQVSEQITEVMSQLEMSRSALSQVDFKLRGTLEPTMEDHLRAEQDPSVSSHIQTVIAIKTELRRLRDKYNPDHGAVVDMENRLRATEDERDSKIDEIIRRDLEAEKRMMNKSVENLLYTLERLEDDYEGKEQKLRELAEDQSELESLIRRREHLQDSRQIDMQLKKEVSIMRTRADASRIRMAKSADVPNELFFPRGELIIPLGALLVVGLTVGLIFFRELTDQRVKMAADIAVIPGADVAGIIPDKAEDPTRAKAPELVVLKTPNSVMAESYRQAFATLNKSLDRLGHQTLLVVGGMPGSGTTTAVTNLAGCWSAADKRVLVVDANFRRPRLAEAMGGSAGGPGLGDVLSGAVTLSEAIEELESGLSVMPAGSPANRVLELLNTRKFDSLLAELRDRYDLIIFDSPPAVVAGEAMVLAGKIDASLLVVRANQEERGLVARLVNQLNGSQSELLGVLLNRPRRTVGGYFKKNFATMAAYSREG